MPGLSKVLEAATGGFDVIGRGLTGFTSIFVTVVLLYALITFCAYLAAAWADFLACLTSFWTSFFWLSAEELLDDDEDEEDDDDELELEDRPLFFLFGIYSNKLLLWIFKLVPI